MNEQPKNPLHGVTLKAILEFLIAEYGFPKLGEKIAINCFIDKPSLNSSLVFLRKTPWAREKVEKLYLQTIKRQQKQAGK
ncbi:MAG: VF530 family protein [Patescibacteria group bacterium]